MEEKQITWDICDLTKKSFWPRKNFNFSKTLKRSTTEFLLYISISKIPIIYAAIDRQITNTVGSKQFQANIIYTYFHQRHRKNDFDNICCLQFTLTITHGSVMCIRHSSLEYVQTLCAWNVAFCHHLKACKKSQSFGPKLSDSVSLVWISVTVAGFMFEKLTTETSTWDIWKQADVLQYKN